MKKAIMILSMCVLFFGCTNKQDEIKGIRQIENMGYTNVKMTGYAAFCCDEKDTFSSGFTATDKNGNLVKGCICSGLLKGITVRFE